MKKQLIRQLRVLHDLWVSVPPHEIHLIYPRLLPKPHHKKYKRMRVLIAKLRLLGVEVHGWPD